MTIASQPGARRTSDTAAQSADTQSAATQHGGINQTASDAGAKPEGALFSPVADPAPLGLAAFAMTTFVLSVFNANIISNAKLEAVVLPLALFYGGLAQFAAGMWEFRNRNTFGALAFTSFGAFWLSFAAFVKYVDPGLPKADAYQALGLYLLVWAIFTGYMLIVSLRVSVAVAAVFLTLFVTFLLLCIGTLNANTSITHAGGWVGLVTAVVAWYASFAGVMNATWKKTVMPVVPLG
ncbi:MAG: acetate uptake transporter [Actinomycetota bacterium]|nr:acetate uptake transporter [Actinomycetota bacterium]